MGNEGSLPQGGTVENVDEQLEYQAKAPPSATTPPGFSTTNDGNSHSLNTHGPVMIEQQHAGGGGLGNGKNHRSGRQLMGAVLKRRGNAHNQNSTGIERTPPPMETAASYPPSSQYNNQSGPTSAVITPGENLSHREDDQGYYDSSQGVVENGNDIHRHSRQPPLPPQQPIYIQQQHSHTQSSQYAIPNQHYYNAEPSSSTLTKRPSTKKVGPLVS